MHQRVLANALFLTSPTFKDPKGYDKICLVKMPLAGQFTALPSCVSRDAGDAAWPGWTCQGLSLSPLSGLSWLLARSVLRHHKTSWTAESLWTNQRPGLSLTGQSEARDQPQPDDDDPGSQVSRFLH